MGLMNVPRHFALRCAIGGIFVFGLVQSAQVSRDGTLSVRIVTAANGRPTPARVTLQDASGVRPHVRGAVAISDSAIPIPKQAIAVMWGQQDRAEGYALQPDGSFYVDGAFDVRLPPGDYTRDHLEGHRVHAPDRLDRGRSRRGGDARVPHGPLDRYAGARLVFVRRSHPPAALAGRRSRDCALDRGGRHPRRQPAADGRFLVDVFHASTRSATRAV